MDGPPDVNDRARFDHAGRSSYADVVKGISALRQAGVPLHILSVVQFGQDGVRAHKHFLELGAESIDYLFPDFTHNNVQRAIAQYGPTPCSDYLIPIFDEWWFNGAMKVVVRLFWTITRLILGGSDEIDLFGNKPLRFMFVEADGSIEGLDVLRVCKEGMASTGLSVLKNEFADAIAVAEEHHRAIFWGTRLPTACKACPEAPTCGGGYLPHRYSSTSGFDNPSVWCADILVIFAHLRSRLEVTCDETRKVVIALVVTTDGLPLAYEVLPGNTADCTTLRMFLARIEQQYGRARRVWVMDRGIPTEAVLAEMRGSDPPVQYLVGTPKGRLSRLEKQLLTKPWQEARAGVQVKLLAEENQTGVDTRSRPSTSLTRPFGCLTAMTASPSSIR